MNKSHLNYFAAMLLLLPLSLSAQVYKCASQGDTYYSQIPCEEESEVVVFENQLMFSESPSSVNPVAEPSEDEPELEQSSGMMNFVTTLERQRDQEIDDLDRTIRQVELSLNDTESLPVDDPQRVALDQSLAELMDNRSATLAQYDSMIAEAQSRVGELSAGGL